MAHLLRLLGVYSTFIGCVSFLPNVAVAEESEEAAISSEQCAQLEEIVINAALGLPGSDIDVKLDMAAEIIKHVHCPTLPTRARDAEYFEVTFP